MSKDTLKSTLLSTIEKELQHLVFPEKPTSLYEPYRYALDMGGKRIRPFLTLLANGLCGGKLEDAIPSALAVEVLHNFTLVHDDIMDSADTRRGFESVFKKWNENIAILSGDVMFADCYRLLEYYGSNDEFSKEEYFAIHKVFNKSIITVCEGQALDMEFVDRESISLSDYIEMIEGKTSALLSASLEMGGITAHANSEIRKNLHILGNEIGTAFQIQDDYLDATADPEKFGKKLGGDIHEGKKTYLTILALERANLSQTKIINRVLNNPNSSNEDVREILNLLDELDVLSDIKKEIQIHYEIAFKNLDEFRDSEFKHELKNLLIFLQNRDH